MSERKAKQKRKEAPCPNHPRYTGATPPYQRKDEAGRTCSHCWGMYYRKKGIPYNPKTMRSLAKVHTRYYQKKGDQVQGITTIISNHNGDKGGMIHAAWRLGTEGIDYKEEWHQKATAGTIAHEMIRAYLLGIKHDFTEQYSKELVRQADVAFQGFLEWKSNWQRFETILIEEPLVSELHPYGATLDWYGYLNDYLTLVDFKTGKAIYWNHKVQVAGCTKMLKEHGYTVDRVRILHITKGEEGEEEAAPQFSDHPQSGLIPHWNWFSKVVEANQDFLRIAKGWK